MKIKIGFVLALVFSFITGNSQILFEKYFGTIGANNAGFYVQEVSNGYVISGSSDNDGIIIRTNLLGDSIWKQTYPDGTVESLRPAGNAGFVLAGTNYAPGYTGVFREVDSSGIMIWDTITGIHPFTMYGVSAIQMPDGDFAILENDYYPNLEFLRIIKISALNHDTLWTREISMVAGCSSSSFILTYDSSLVIANGTFTVPYPGLILSKTNSNGVLNWEKDYFFTGDTGVAGNSVFQTTDSGFIVIGYQVFGNPQSQNRLFIMKTDANGDSLWTKVYNLRNSSSFPDIIQTADGGFALVGTVNYPLQGGFYDNRIVLMKTDTNGDSLWTREFTGYGLSEAKKIIQTADSGFAIIGSSTDQNVNQSYLYLIKTDSLGYIVDYTLPCNPLLTVDFPNACNPNSNLVSIPSFGVLPNDYYLYSSSWTLLQADTGLAVPDSLSNLSPGNYYVIINDSSVCGIDTLDFFIHESIDLQIDSVIHTSCIGCTDGKIYFSVTGGIPAYTINTSGGILSGNMISNLASGPYSICAIDSNHCASCDQVTVQDDLTAISNILERSEFFIYPNPVSNITTLHFKAEGMTSIRILDMKGRPVKEILDDNLTQGNHELVIDCNGLESGFYTVEISFRNRSIYKSLVKI